MQLCRYIDLAWQEEESRSLVGDLISGLSDRVDALRRKLYGSWRLHAAWGRHELPARAWPFLVDHCLACSWVAWQWGMADMSLILLVAFDCILRTGEAMSLTVG